MKRITNIKRWHRMVLVFGATAILALAFATKAMAQSSVPNLINFQGRLADNTGNPVADGSHNLTFRIFDGDITEPGATLLWTEGPLGITTSGGLFNHSLGSSMALPQTLFQDNDRLYLEIEADGETLSPRTPLISNPYTRMADAATLAQDLTCNGCVSAAEIATNAVGSDEIATNAVVGGLSGDIFDGTITDDDLAANSVTSSEVADGSLLATDIGDEPGVASVIDLGLTPLLGPIQTLLSRTITVPATGYVFAIATTEVLIIHTNGTNSQGLFGVSSIAGAFPLSQDALVQIPSTAPSGTYAHTVTVHGLFSVAAGANTFYFLGLENFGDVSSGEEQLTLVYFPSSYGTVEPTVASAMENLPDEKAQSASALLPEATIELAAAPTPDPAALQRELAEMKARMQKLEEILQQKAVENEQ